MSTKLSTQMFTGKAYKYKCLQTCQHKCQQNYPHKCSQEILHKYKKNQQTTYLCPTFMIIIQHPQHDPTSTFIKM